MKSTKNPVLQTWFFKLEISKIKWGWIGGKSSGTYLYSFLIIDMTSEISSKLNDTTTDVGHSIFKPCDESIDFQCKSERTFCVPKYWLCDGVVSF